MNAVDYAVELTKKARAASRVVATAGETAKNDALRAAADLMLTSGASLKRENAKDLIAGREAGLSAAMIDRLELTDVRIEAMADGLRNVADLPDPVGRVIDGWRRPNGLNIRRVRVPIGVLCIIFESRPNVTADAASLCLKSGNACILRGGKEAIHSNLAIHGVLAQALERTGLPPDAVQLVNTPDRAVVDELLAAEGRIDMIVPRGGKGLIKAVTEKARMPVIKHYEGICHVYVDEFADLEMARRICVNAKCQRPGVCNAMETMLVHSAVAGEFLPKVAAELREAGCILRGCAKTRAVLPDVAPATDEDWTTEYLSLDLSIRVVDSTRQAIDHINDYGSHHTDAIVTRDVKRADEFVEAVDSACVFVNCSTRFSDGHEFGLGAEVGISTDKLHCRGPMGLEELTTYKWVVEGDGQLRR